MKNAYKAHLYSLIISSYLLIFSFSISYSQDVEAGKKLFNANCASCHKLDKKVIGPALAGVTERRTNEWLIAWIRNNIDLRASGDKDAIAIYEEYNGTIMNTFPQFADEDINNILSYIENPPITAKPKPPKDNTPSQGSTADFNPLLKWLLGALIVLLLLIIGLLYFIIRLMKKISEEKGASEKHIDLPIVEQAEKVVKTIYDYLPGIVALGSLLFVISLYVTWKFMIQIDNNKGYEPIQPIAFSHKIHAGDNKIDCQYCHYSARHSKTSGIPAVNVCMNCHRYIFEGPNTGTQEIAKIYKAVGWDIENQKYIENYKYKPIKWVRVHNLPDFVYFNHSQHIDVGELECTECHGDVKEMDVLQQASDLTMEWCINCHRKEGVKMNNNPYYKKINEQLHEQLADKLGVEKVTVAMMGGIECGKCHY